VPAPPQAPILGAPCPDTNLGREGRAIVSTVLSPAVLNHSLRAFLLGQAYAHRFGVDFDDEGLYLAALFHDLGLFPGHRAPGQAFQLASSRELKSFLEAHNVPAARIRSLGEAIDFHMQLLPRWSRGNVAGLMQVGAWMDVTMLRRWSVRKEARAVAHAYPREGIDLEFPRRLLGTFTSLGACAGLLLPERFR
jgi:hypothetical protein